MDPAYLANKLARALAEIVPDGFQVYEDQGMVFIKRGVLPAATGVAEIVDQSGEGETGCDGTNDIQTLVGWASENALSHVQDYIAEELTIPWPNERGQLPVPKVRVTEARIELWLEGANGERVLEVPPIVW